MNYRLNTPVELIDSTADTAGCFDLLVREHSLTDFEYRRSLYDRNPRSIAYSQIVFLRLSNNPPDAHREMLQALLSPDHDVVVGMGLNLPGRYVSHWTAAGMFDYIDLPPEYSKVEDCYHRANDECIRIRAIQTEYNLLQLQRESLNTSEVEVLDLILQGVPNKSIAYRLDVSQRTVESRRQRVYQKFNAKRLPDLLRCIERLTYLERQLKRRESSGVPQ